MKVVSLIDRSHKNTKTNYQRIDTHTSFDRKKQQNDEQQ